MTIQRTPSRLTKFITTKEMVQIGIVDNLFKYWQPHQLIHLTEKKPVLWWLKIFCLPEKMWHLLKIKKSLFNLYRASRKWFVMLYYPIIWNIFPSVISLLSEWSIYKIAILPYITAAFSYKYILEVHIWGSINNNWIILSIKQLTLVTLAISIIVLIIIY